MVEKLWALVKLIAINWKTTIAGAVVIIIVAFNNSFGLNLDAEEIVAAIGAFLGVALLFARDANVTSEGTKITEQRLEAGEDIEAEQMDLAERFRARKLEDIARKP
jgi:hypothetical protein